LARHLHERSPEGFGDEGVDGEPKERANPGNHVILTTHPVLEHPKTHAVLRKKNNLKN
jgi:hypothetical protein